MVPPPAALTSAADAAPAEVELPVLRELEEVLSSSLLDVAARFSAMLAGSVPHRALLIFTEDCTGRPKKKSGDPQIIDRASIAELDRIREGLHVRGERAAQSTELVAGAPWRIAAWIASTGALLVLVEPEADAGDDIVERVAALWNLVAVGIRNQVAAASPDYLADSRRASGDRAALIAELMDAHATSMESILAVLRSRDTPDAVARQAAVDLAASAMVRLREVSDRDRHLSEEPVATAFERLRTDLRPLERFGDLDVQFVEPPVDGRALPGEVAHAGRAIVRGVVLALVDQQDIGRIRIQWDCDGANLLITVRDDGPGDLSIDSDAVRQLTGRVRALHGTLGIEATAGWGSMLSVALPLDSQHSTEDFRAAWRLTVREREVLALLVEGASNRVIAGQLSVSENTVKFHVANLLRKAEVSTRAQLIAALH